jgi:dethiobiotin synthetase
MSRFVITGTGTGIGKTIFAAALAQALGAVYWKPIQAGLEGETDTQAVARLGEVETLPETYRFHLPASPHLAAAREDVVIEKQALMPPDAPRVVIEGAGGVLVPLTRTLLAADLFTLWQIPVILVATTQLGTISHSLTAIEALKARGVLLHGIAFVGDAHADNETIIPEISGVRRLGRLPWLSPLTPQNLRTSFVAHFHLEDFQ